MSTSGAFTYHLNPIGSNASEGHNVHQTSPSWLLTFIRFSVRDALRTTPTPTNNYQTVRPGDPLVVENDCVNVSVVIDKGTLTHSMSATLKMTDVNYETAVAPGDFVLVNMLNWEDHSRRVANQARAKQPINGPHDGFKGVFKVQGVKKFLGTDPETGKKAFFIQITGFSFTEFNNVIYFNPELIYSNETTDLLLYVSNIASNWAILQNEKGVTSVQDIVEALINSFIGTGIGDTGKTVKGGIIKSPNTLFYIPTLLGTLLGVSNAKAAKDIYNFMFGIQQYSGSSNQSLAVGMNPNNVASNNSRVWKPSDNASKCQGETITKPEYWNQVKVWSIFNQFSNSPLNEMFSCFRISPTGRVMPTMVFRQIPFTTEDFEADTSKVTRFMNLPRWKIHPALITQFNIGRDESARINFVQYYGRSTLGPDGFAISAETAQKNYLYDIDDVKRSGLRPYVVTTTFDETIPDGKSVYKSVKWAKIVGDALIGGHLKLNGTIESAGIVAPIAVGDNLELDGVVYHIERVSHTAGIDPETGKKIFRSSFGLSSGLSKDSSVKGTKYSEMTYEGAYGLRKVDGGPNGNRILPGVSESQDVVYRPNSLDVPHSVTKGFTQPNNNTSVNKTGVENQSKETNKK
jgi:hypothetical protein